MRRVLSGFTLIELSMVLVIIGLLTSGILLGRELIEVAQLRKIITEHERYNTMVNAFRLKYGCLPGDCGRAAMFNLGTSGDGDAVIDYDLDVSSGASDVDTDHETLYFWQHLTRAGMMNSEFSGTYDTSCGFNCYVMGEQVPSGPITGSIVTFFKIPSSSIAPSLYMWGGTTPDPNAWATTQVNRHVMILGAIEGPDDGRWHNPVLKPVQQASIDGKVDDGKPYTGILTDILGDDANFGSPDCTTTEDATAEYDGTYTEKACVILWRAMF